MKSIYLLLSKKRVFGKTILILFFVLYNLNGFTQTPTFSTLAAGSTSMWSFGHQGVYWPSNNHIYITSGYDGSYLNQIHDYDIGNDAWGAAITGTTSTAGPGTSGMPAPYGFAWVLNNGSGQPRIYFGGGANGGFEFPLDNYEWDPAVPGTFNNMDNNTHITETGRGYGFDFQIGNYGYYGSGFGEAGSPVINPTPDMERFDPTAPPGSQWTTMSSYPGSGPYLACGSAVNGYGYVGLGTDFLGNYYNDFYRYIPATDSWSLMAAFPGAARSGARLVPYGSVLLLIGGNDGGAAYDDVWMFNPGVPPSTGAWTNLGSHPEIAGPENGRAYFAAATAGTRVYFGFGNNGAGSNDWNWMELTDVLPINLISFKAVSDEGSINLEWITDTESNNDYFTLESSSDAQNFIAIDVIDGAGNSKSRKSYNYIDNSNNNSTVTYYRLKQTDFDKKFKYSETISVVKKGSLQITNVYPNPSASVFNCDINISENTQINVNVIDALGRSVKDTQTFFVTKGLNSLSLDMSMIESGTYFLEIQTVSGSYKTQKKLVK